MVLLGSGWHPGFRLPARPTDRCLAIPQPRGSATTWRRRLPEQLEAFFAAMRRERSTRPSSRGGGGHSNPFLRRLCPHDSRILRSPTPRPSDCNICYTLYQPEALRFLEAELVGASLVTLEPRLQVTAADRAEASRVLPGDSRPLVVLHPGGHRPAPPLADLPVATVGAELARKGARLAVVGTAADALTAHPVGLLEGDAADLTGRFSLGGLAGLLEGPPCWSATTPTAPPRRSRRHRHRRCPRASPTCSTSAH